KRTRGSRLGARDSELGFRRTALSDLKPGRYRDAISYATVTGVARIVLASASPRRAELLTSAGFEFEIQPADVDETLHAGETPEVYALRVARLKARAVRLTCRNSDSPVLAADTVVIVDGCILGKPHDSEDARDMLKSLSGAVHQVLTAVVVRVGE